MEVGSTHPSVSNVPDDVPNRNMLAGSDSSRQHMSVDRDQSSCAANGVVGFDGDPVTVNTGIDVVSVGSRVVVVVSGYNP